MCAFWRKNWSGLWRACQWHLRPRCAGNQSYGARLRCLRPRFAGSQGYSARADGACGRASPLVRCRKRAHGHAVASPCARRGQCACVPPALDGQSFGAKLSPTDHSHERCHRFSGQSCHPIRISKWPPIREGCCQHARFIWAGPDRRLPPQRRRYQKSPETKIRGTKSIYFVA
jgi:hypothetical protein